MATKTTIIEWELLCWMVKHRQEDGRALRIEGDHVRLFGPSIPMTANLKKAAYGCLRNEYIALLPGCEWPDYVATAAGEAIAAGERPAWTPKLPPLDERDLTLLGELSEVWQTPLDCGGSNGSYHSASLAKLCAHGLAEASYRSYPIRPSIFARNKGSNKYKITRAGQAKYREFIRRAKPTPTPSQPSQESPL